MWSDGGHYEVNKRGLGGAFQSLKKRALQLVHGTIFAVYSAHSSNRSVSLLH